MPLIFTWNCQKKINALLKQTANEYARFNATSGRFSSIFYKKIFKFDRLLFEIYEEDSQ